MLNIVTTSPLQSVENVLKIIYLENMQASKIILINTFIFILGQTAVDRIKKVVRTFRIRGQFKGLGGELMKQACATLIKKCAIIHFPVHSTEVVGNFCSLLPIKLKLYFYRIDDLKYKTYFIFQPIGKIYWRKA